MKTIHKWTKQAQCIYMYIQIIVYTPGAGTGAWTD
jgi:hypothetical protein